MRLLLTCIPFGRIAGVRPRDAGGDNADLRWAARDELKAIAEIITSDTHAAGKPIFEDDIATARARCRDRELGGAEIGYEKAAPETVAKVMGGNELRFLRAQLPAG